jgi:TolA-binding protein
LALGIVALTGCTVDECRTWDAFGMRPLPKLPQPPEDLTLGANGFQSADKKPTTEAEKMLYGAHELRRRGDLTEAQRVFHRIADNKKNPSNIAEEARFYEAECLYERQQFPRACDTYHELIKDFPMTPYKEQALSRMFTIAQHWLDDTRRDMDIAKAGDKHWYTPPTWLHLMDSTKPWIGEEGRAEEALQNISFADRYDGPYADMALFLLGAVSFYRQDFKEADAHFTMLLEYHKDSQFAPQALQMAIISKYLSTGGADYDARRVAEARQMVHKMLNKYHDKLTPEETDKLMKRLGDISYLQADKDLKTAEFYERVGKPTSAYFCYEVVRRRYPRTKFFDTATKRMHELREKAEKEGKQLPAIEAPQPPPDQPVPTSETPKMLPAPTQQPGR